jgi:hypothetical protein
MLEGKILRASPSGTLVRADKRHIAFTQCDDVLFVVVEGKKLAEAPNAALVERVIRGAPLPPKLFQTGRRALRRIDHHVEEVAATWARQFARVQLESRATLRRVTAEVNHAGESQGNIL